MINSHSITTLSKAVFGNNLIKPQYDTYSFHAIPGTIEKALHGSTRLDSLPDSVFGDLPRSVDHVVVLMVDAFGWSFFERFLERYDFLSRFEKKGTVSKLTSQFPSTTTAELTSFHTGLPVGRSGVFEWYYYEPDLATMVCPILFSSPGENAETLAPKERAADVIFPRNTFYQTLTENRIQSHIFQYQYYLPSTFVDEVFRGATAIHPWKTFPAACTLIPEIIQQSDQKTLSYLYFSGIDTVSHQYGPDSIQLEAEADALFTTLERTFIPLMEKHARNTLFIVTADHGQTKVNPETTIYLNREIPELPALIRDVPGYGLLVPGGSCKDMFLYIKDKKIATAEQLLAKTLRERALVRRTQELLEEGFFGPPPYADRFEERLGDLVILPVKGESVWWYEKDKFELKHKGAHGGLHHEEMEIPLLMFAWS